jgi:Membrane bound O-acyl transferase family
MTLLFLLIWGLSLLLIGYCLPFLKDKTFARIVAWSLILLTTVFATQITANEPALYRMLAIVSLQLLSMKCIVMVETYTGKPKLNVVQWLAFSAWFGMRPVLFEQLFSRALTNVKSIVIKGLVRVAIGFALLFLSKHLDNQAHNTFFLPELLALFGLSFILHFGILNLSTALWRFCGVDVKELFRSPYQSKSLKEFWGKRWNMAFSEMTALVAYRPLKGFFGKNLAMMSSFLLSGILHEIAISCPVKSGYGLPLMYFALHCFIMFAEDKFDFVKAIVQHKILSRVWVLAWLILPMPLLFHERFMENVIFPLRNIILNIV